MAIFDITTTNGLAEDRWTYYELNQLVMTTEIRNKAGEQDVEEFRKTLRLSGHWLIKEVEDVLVPNDSLTTAPNIEVTISGGTNVTITPGTDMGSFKLMGQEIYPEDAQGWGVNTINDEWTSVASEWSTLDWQAPIDIPAHAIASNVGSTTYVDLVSTENASVWNESREEEGVDQFRTRIRTTQFYDVDAVTAVSGLHADLYRVATIPACGFNNDLSVSGGQGLIVDPFEFDQKWILTVFSLTPINKFGGKFGRVRYTWEMWTEWQTY